MKNERSLDTIRKPILYGKNKGRLRVAHAAENKKKTICGLDIEPQDIINDVLDQGDVTCLRCRKILDGKIIKYNQDALIRDFVFGICHECRWYEYCDPSIVEETQIGCPDFKIEENF